MVLTITLLQNCNEMNTKSDKSNSAPIAEKRPKKLVAHGDTRIDEYYWMRLSDEQKMAKDPDEQTRKVLNYLDEENEYLDQQLGHTMDLQEKLFDEITGRIKKEDESVPYYKNGYWYYTRYETGQEYPVYCRRKETMDNEEEIMLNVNEMAKGHGFYNIGGLSVSPDNQLLAYAEDTLSRRIYTIKFKDLTTGKLLDDEINNTETDIAWANDNKTIFYTSKNEVTLLSEKIKRHTFGDTNDTVVYHEEDPSFYIGVSRSRSGKYIFISNRSTLVNDYHILRTDNPLGAFRNFTAREKDMLYSIEHVGDEFYILTNWEAKNFRLMKADEEATEKANWEEVLAHRDSVLLEGMELFNNYLVLEEREAGLTSLRIRNRLNGQEHYINFEEEAYATGIFQNPEISSEWLRFAYTSLTTPMSTYDYNMDTREKVLKKREEVVGGHDVTAYTTERIYAKARDGSEVPISIVYKNGFEKNGSGPLLLYGYGSYGITIDPTFRSDRLSLLDRGFAFAIAHVRGGQLLGRQWYEDGKLLKKKNTFYDFIDCAKHLIELKYTSSEHIYAMGGSAGGLLMGAVLNMEPLRFNGIIASVPFVDVVTTMSDPTIPLTTNEYDEWGNPADKEYYNYMMTYSPYDNVEVKEYTNILVTTGLFDSQVQYWEPAKWVAKLRDLKTDNNMLLFNINMEAGHGGASGRFRRYKEVALQYAFLLDLEGIGE